MSGTKSVQKCVKIFSQDLLTVMVLGLDKLASNLDDDQCKHLSEFYKENEVFRLMRRKGVYPYEYMDGWEKIEETRLPPKDAFYSRRNMKGISDQDHKHAQQVCNIRVKKNPGCYHHTYLKTDVLLLVDVFETFQDICLTPRWVCRVRSY